jgi:hypothetical protein
MTHNKTILTLTLILLLGLMPACGRNDTAKANKAVGEANSISEEWVKTLDEGGTKMETLYAGNVDIDERQKQEPTAKEALNSFDKSKAKANEAAQKLEDASKLNLDAWHKDYLSTLAQQYRKGSEMTDALREMVKAYMDYSLDAQAFAQKHDELSEQVGRMRKEVDELSAKTTKIEAEHKDQMKQ